MILDTQSHAITPPGALSFVDHLAHREPDRAGQYDRDSFVAYILNLAASWAYADAATVADAMGRIGLPHCRQITLANEAMLIQANAYFIQSEDGRQAILCFRGTEPRNVINWLTDASVHVEPVPGMGRMHGGFYRNVVFIWHRIEEVLDQALAGARVSDGNGGEARLRPIENLYLTGHSLGAAMAVVAAAKIFDSDRYREWKRRVRGIYTFGQPIVGDREFADVSTRRFGHLLFRHVYDHDLVPRMPPVSTGKFVHFGQEYRGSPWGWEPTNTPVEQVDSALFTGAVGVAAWLFRQLRFFGRLQLPFSIDDHSPNNYLRASRAELGSEWYSDLAMGGTAQPAPHAQPTEGATAH